MQVNDEAADRYDAMKIAEEIVDSLPAHEPEWI
jgi:hypothetical protein